MIDLTEIKAGPASLILAPAMGGGIARLDVAGKPVLRPWVGDETAPFSLACNVLTPFSNRISGGGFEWNEVFHRLTPNLEGEPFPIHGDGFQKPWTITKSGTCARMTLSNGAFGPWRYSAQQELSLTPNHLTIRLTLTNRGQECLPFGFGLHPWFPRDENTQLSFRAETVWMEDKSHLPTEELWLADAPDWSFASARGLPSKWVNNCYNGWSGETCVLQSSSFMSCKIKCDGQLPYGVLFSPRASSDFFCFEPVSHPVDGLNLPSQPGLKELATDEYLETSIVFSW